MIENGERSRALKASANAQAAFRKVRSKDDEAVRAREALRTAEAEKTARLRALRLAKEAADSAARAAARPRAKAAKRPA